MSTTEFTVTCFNCSGEVNGWYQSIQYMLLPNVATQAGQTIYLSCGCVVDFPEWKIDLNTGQCEILDYTGKVFIKFLDEELLLEEED